MSSGSSNGGGQIVYDIPDAQRTAISFELHGKSTNAPAVTEFVAKFSLILLPNDRQ